MFSLARRKTTQQQPVQMQFGYRQIPSYIVNKPVAPQVQQQDILPKMKWGRPIWTFFHVMAQKVKLEYFNLVIRDFLKNIRSKDDLINLFYIFHNVVNQRKGYAVLQKNQIPNYETANTIFVIKDFIRAYEDKSRSMKLMADDIARARISSQFKFWINENIRYFEP